MAHPNELRDEFEKLDARIEELTSKDELTEEERTELEAADKRADELVADIKKAEEREARKATFAALPKNAPIKPEPEVRVEVTNEPETYSETTARQGISFFRDIVTAKDGDWDAVDRLRKHRSFVETRDVGTSAFAGLTVPQYLTDLVAPHRKAGRPTLNIANTHPLPGDGMTVNISRITTGSGIAAQASENAAVQETNMDDTLLTVNVNTYAGMQDVSRQAIDRSTGVDSIVIADLVRAYDTTVNSAVINADGTSGTHLGIRSTSSIVAVTYTDASPTAAELHPKLFDLVQQVQAGVYLGLTHFIMHPRRFWWLASQVGTSFPFLQIFDAPQGAGGVVSSRGYESGASGVLAGVPVIVDANIPTNLGGGTEDVILGVTNSELHFWEEAGSPLRIRSDDVLANQLSVRFVVYGYSAFSAGRYPGAHGTITGTGLAAPTF